MSCHARCCSSSACRVPSCSDAYQVQYATTFLFDHRYLNTVICCAAQVCIQKPTTLTTWQYVLVSLAALATLCVLVMLASLFVSLCLARTGKVRRQVEWWRKHLSGMPQVGKMSIVVTDIEGYSGV